MILPLQGHPNSSQAGPGRAVNYQSQTRLMGLHGIYADQARGCSGGQCRHIAVPFVVPGSAFHQSRRTSSPGSGSGSISASWGSRLTLSLQQGKGNT